MRLKNIGQSNFEFTQPKAGQKKGEMLETITVKPGDEIVVKKDDPLYDKFAALPKQYPAAWIEVKSPELTEDELKEQLAKIDADKKAKAEAAKAAKADAKKAGKDEDEKKDA